ncbi:hypothetical protein FHX42_005312 [Saccharopolyspora lacisalsi]|uniref:Peptidase M50B-like protein n=1 Tax=Halosaccharopolyspora lacisalsi TaxID=1000566 RepID=A0A839E7L7_9PSEU|nr:M50 family metallopeptidase [Halosaccharopolyspora lacisalsi]MBA8827905.1 hypothetical protein [Halosaccharopolyspora lacisalsi]
MNPEDVATTIADAVTATTPAPTWWMVLATGIAAALVAIPNSMVRMDVVSTLTHEAGHGIASLLTGGGAHRIELTSPDSGTTTTSHTDSWSDVITCAAGYLAPPASGLWAAFALSDGHAPAVLAAGVAVALFVLALARNTRAFLSSIITAAVLAALLVSGAAWAQTTAVTLIVWLLLVCEFGSLVAMVGSRITGKVWDHDDAKALAEMTRIPALLWIAGWSVFNGWALYTATTGILWA